MRVTNSMMIHNMVYWSAKQRETLNDISTVVSSGKQINKPSDNASATRQILEDRATISSYDQYSYNAELAQTWITVSDTTLGSIYELLQEVTDVVTADMTSDNDSAEATAQTVQSIYDQILSMANDLYGSGYMYSGNSSDVMPFSSETTVTGGGASDITYNLASDAQTVTIEISDSSGNVVRTLTAGSGTEGTNTVSWDGLDDSGTTLPDGDYTFTVTATDANGAAVASYPTYQGDTGGKEFIIGKDASITVNNNGDSIFSSSLKVLSEIVAALTDTSTTDVSTKDFADELSAAISGIENQEVLLSNANTIVSNISDRLDSLTATLEDRISAIETGDTTTAAAELTAQETAYETTLSALSSVLKMAKLSDYL